MTRKLLFLAALLSGPATASPPKLLPVPSHVAEHRGAFRLSPSEAIRVPPRDEGAATAARYLAMLLRSSNGLDLKVRHASGAIRFVRTRGFPVEGYAIASDRRGLTVTASSDAGLLYGAVTAWQLASGDEPNLIPAVTIRDAPRFGWRGLMLDSARHFQSPAFVRKLLDWMAVNKLNVLHWHLVDDQGLRLEIRKYPRLTQVSAWRVPATAPGAPPLPRVGGYYTQAEVRAIVVYAAARNITIVPEIEMPGHALSAIRAYPRLGTGAPVPPGVESDWGVFPWLYNVDDDTFSFLEDVLGEVMTLFPSRFIHVGGDEADKAFWKTNPRIQARIRELGLKDEKELQSWFIKRMDTFLAQHGRRLVGWDEILEGGLAPGATVMSWRGMQGGATAAKSGHDVIMAPMKWTYLDHYQVSDRSREPLAIPLITPLDTVYSLEPVPAELTPAEARHVLGAQAQLWTELIATPKQAEYMLFPRLAAFAEAVWTPADRKDLASFHARLPRELARLDALDVNYRPTP